MAGKFPKSQAACYATLACRRITATFIVLLILIPKWGIAFEVEKPGGTTLTTDGETETITVSGTRYFLWPVPVDNENLVFYTSVPGQYKGPAIHVSQGEPIEYDELIKVLEVHYRNSAFDFDTLKLRNVTIDGIRYAVYCAAGFGCNHAFRAGVRVELEVNGKNRLGGMTGFEKATFLITKIAAGETPSPVVLEQADGRILRPTTDDLKQLLTDGITVKSARSTQDSLAAARAVLEADGYTVLPSDTSIGTIYTEARDMKFSSKAADCGKKWGMGYIGDKRTETTIIIAIAAAEGQLTVQAGVGGILRIKIPFGAGAADEMLTCKSTGTLEQDIAAKLSARLN